MPLRGLYLYHWIIPSLFSFFQSETVVVSFFHLMVLFSQVDINHTSICQLLVLLCHIFWFKTVVFFKLHVFVLNLKYLCFYHNLLIKLFWTIFLLLFNRKYQRSLPEKISSSYEKWRIWRSGWRNWASYRRQLSGITYI